MAPKKKGSFSRNNNASENRPDDTQPASQGIITPDLNESAIGSESEDSSPPRNSDSLKLNKPSLKPAPLFVKRSPELPSIPSAAGSTSGGKEHGLAIGGRNATPTSAPGLSLFPGIITGIQVDSPSAVVAPLFSSPLLASPDHDAATQVTASSNNFLTDSGSEISYSAGTFSDHEAGELAAVAHATTPNTEFSPLPTRRDFRQTISPTPEPTSTPNQAAEATEDAAPIHPNPYFNAVDNRDGNLLYPEPEDPRDRAAIMPMDPNAVPALRRHRSDRTNIEEAKVAAELAIRNPPPDPENLLGTIRPKEISDFKRYAEDNPDSECLKMGMKALEAALVKEREQVIEHLKLVNANRELAERIAIIDQQLKRTMEDAARQRKVGQYSEEDMDNAVLGEKNKRKEVEAMLKQIRKTAEQVEFVDNKYAKEHARVLDAEQRIKEDRDVILGLRTQVKEQDAEIQKLLGEKGSLISMEECADFNATILRKHQDEIISLQTQLGESQSKVNDLYSALEAGKARLGASSDSNVSDTNGHLMTEEQCEKHWETEIELLRTDKEALSNQLENAQETIRLVQEPTSETPGGGVSYEVLLKQFINAQEELQSYQKHKLQNEQGEAAYNDLSVHEQPAHLRDPAARDDALIETQQQLLMRRGALGGDSVGSEDFEYEYKKLRTEIWAKNKGIAEQAAYVESLESERINLLRSQEVLRQINDELRIELDTTKSKFKEVKTDRDALKERLRGEDGPNSGLGSQGLKDGSYEDPKLVECLEKNIEYERAITSLNMEIEGHAIKSAGTQAEIGELQILIEDLHLKLAVSSSTREEATKCLEAKILALNEAKADRERQIRRQTTKIKELENAESGNTSHSCELRSRRSTLNSKFLDGGESRVSPKLDFFMARLEIPASFDAIHVVLLRCELQLGQVQARRQRWGFMEGDTSDAIEIAMEAQGMAEQLEDPKSIGRALFWRGVAEFMAGNSTAAEVYFETSASYHWIQKGQEEEILQEWWEVSKTELVDKTTNISPKVIEKISPLRSERKGSKTQNQKKHASQKHRSDLNKSKDRMKKRAKNIKIKSAQLQSPAAATLAALEDSPVSSGNKRLNGWCSTQ